MSVETIVLLVVGVIVISLIGKRTDGKAQQEESSVEKTDATLAAQEKPVPPVAVIPPPTERAMTPDEVLAYWNDKKDGNK